MSPLEAIGFALLFLVALATLDSYRQTRRMNDSYEQMRWEFRRHKGEHIWGDTWRAFMGMSGTTYTTNQNVEFFRNSMRPDWIITGDWDKKR